MSIIIDFISSKNLDQLTDECKSLLDGSLKQIARDAGFAHLTIKVSSLLKKSNLVKDLILLNA